MHSWSALRRRNRGFVRLYTLMAALRRLPTLESRPWPPWGRRETRKRRRRRRSDDGIAIVQISRKAAAKPRRSVKYHFETTEKTTAVASRRLATEKAGYELQLDGEMQADCKLKWPPRGWGRRPEEVNQRRRGWGRKKPKKGNFYDWILDVLHRLTLKLSTTKRKKLKDTYKIVHIFINVALKRRRRRWWRSRKNELLPRKK